MLEILTADEMKKVDNCSVNDFKIPSLALMETAARCVYTAIKKKHGINEKIVVVAGMGNNGADGIAAARMLKADGYREVSVITTESREKKHTKEWEIQSEAAKRMGIPIKSYDSGCEENIFAAYDVIVDGIFGIGLTREVTGTYYEIISKINSSGKTVYAVDIPSGIDGNTGRVMSIAVKADCTVTFENYKVGHILYPGVEYAGNIQVRHIGFPRAAYKGRDIIMSYEKSDLGEIFPKRTAHSNKGTYGKLLLIAGNEQTYGALYMSAKAAFTMGTGLVKVITTIENKDLINSSIPEVMVNTYNDDDYMSVVKEGLEWCSAILIGPGMGVSKRTENILKMCLETKKSIVIDADGINALSKMEDNKRLLHEKVIITPHLVEMSRFINKPVSAISGDLPGICRKTADEYNINIILKDSRSCCCNTNGETYINITGNSGMAKGGSGDVLAGIVSGLLATGNDVKKAGAQASFIHGICGDIAKSKKGEYSMLPTDIIKAMEELQKADEIKKI